MLAILLFINDCKFLINQYPYSNERIFPGFVCQRSLNDLDHLAKSGRYSYQLQHFNMPFLHTCLKTSLPFAIIKNGYNFQDPCHGSSIKILLFCFSCNMPFLPNSCSFSLILLINLCRALRRIYQRMRYYYFPNELICRKLFFFFFFCYSCVLLDSEYVLHFVSSLINFRSFSASKFVLCQFFVLKSFRMPRIVFFQKKTNFSKLSFFHIQKIIFVFEIVHRAVFLL